VSSVYEISRHTDQISLEYFLFRLAGGVTAALAPHNINYVPSWTAQMLTKRRAVDFCRVATALCQPSPASRQLRVLY
jgi:hypothetical protein